MMPAADRCEFDGDGNGDGMGTDGMDRDGTENAGRRMQDTYLHTLQVRVCRCTE